MFSECTSQTFELLDLEIHLIIVNVNETESDKETLDYYGYEKGGHVTIPLHDTTLKSEDCTITFPRRPPELSVEEKEEQRLREFHQWHRDNPNDYVY